MIFFTDQIKIIIKEKELEEYYYSVKIFSKDDVSNYIKNKDTENIKKCKNFDFSEDNYKFFLVALMSKDAKIVRIIYDFINDKNKLINFIQNHNNILEKDDLILFNSLMD
jgi:siroheme synthase (precorrin-2 oxidase/ferrochelatase)